MSLLLRLFPRAMAMGATLAAAVGGCGTPGPSEPAATGAVRVTVQRAGGGGEFFASEHHARVIALDGTVVADWRLAADAAMPVAVPVGDYTLEAFTVFLSDFLQCTPDPARPGQETCFQPTLGPAQVCGAPVTVTAATTTDAVFTILAEGRCRLEAAAAPAGSGPGSSRGTGSPGGPGSSRGPGSPGGPGSSENAGGTG